MKSYSENTLNVFINPIDGIEEIISAYDLDFLRNNKNQLSINFEGLWSNYEIKFNWSQPNGLIQINNNLSIKIPTNFLDKIYHVICLINERISLGYFGYCSDESCLFFRHNVSMKGINYLSTEQIEDFIDIIVQECDKFYPAFQTLIFRNYGAKKAIESALFETIGEA